jgi:uncharacterized protein (TIGR02996 family)
MSQRSDALSSQRAALVAAIRETPDDDAPRLVCADWFEEQGGEAHLDHLTELVWCLAVSFDLANFSHG